MKVKIIAAILLVLVVVGMLAGVKTLQIRKMVAAAKALVPPPETVSSAIVRQEKWQDTLTAIGSISAAQGVMITPDIPGTVREISFDAGAIVQKGDLLVRLDTSSEEAQLRSVDAQVELARITAERERALRKENMVSQSELDSAEAALKQYKANADTIRATIEKKTIRAPFAGQVKERTVTQGQYLKVQTPVMVIVNIDPLRVRLKVPEKMAAWVHEGQEVAVTVEAYADRTFKGKVTRINPSVDQQTRSFEVEALIENHDSALKPGFFAKAVIQSNNVTSALFVPQDALLYVYGVYKVFVIEDNRLKEKEVKLGERAGDEVEITEGLREGERVALPAKGQELRDGAAVEVVR